MVDQIAVVTFVTPASAGTFDVTSSEITETFSAAVFILSGFTNETVDNTHGVLGVGFCAPDTGAANTDEGMSAGAQNRAGGVAPNCNTLHQNTSSIIVIDPTSAVGAAGVLASYSASISGGVRMNFTTTLVRVRVTAILFAGLSRACTDEVTGSTLGASEAVGGTTDFEPDLVIFATSATDLNTSENDAVPNLGFGVNRTGLPQVCAFERWDDGTNPSDADGLFKSAFAFGHIQGGGAFEAFAAITAFTSTGFNHTTTASGGAGSPDAHYLALKFSGFVRLTCKNLAVSAATGDKTFTDYGFTPSLVLGMSHLLATVDVGAADGALAAACGYFVTGGKGSRAYTMSHQEGVVVGNPKVAKSRQEDVAVLNYEHTGTITQRATWVGPSGPTGFKLNFSTAGTAGFLTALGLVLGHTDNDTENISEGVVFHVRQASPETENITDGHVFMGVTPFTAGLEEIEISDDHVFLVEQDTGVTTGDPAGESYSAGSRRGRIAAAGATAGIIF